ncbi:unnamed protein product, partial [Polarella glacialis]
LCFSMDSPVFIACLWVRMEGVHVEDVWAALSVPEERKQWDTASESRLLQPASEDDELSEEVFHMVYLCPRPFWDREVLKRQWKVPLDGPNGQGHALISRSFEDATLLSGDPGNVRAVVHKAGSLLRPLCSGGATDESTASARGVELTNCSQIDFGGLMPSWAQTQLSAMIVSK